MNAWFRAASAAVVSTVAFGAAAQQASADSAKGAPVARAAFPELALPRAGASGQQAIDQIGSRLPELAAWYRRTPDQLRDMLLRDAPLLRVDGKGRLYAVDELQHPLPSRAPEVADQAATDALVPLNQTFTLHSRPGAQRTVYLDFNGAVLTGTAWNTVGRPTINALPFDSDGNTSVLSDPELERIQYIWQRVAEDYAPFDVDVTTEAPSPDRLSRSSLSDQIFGTTVLITNSVGVYDCSCGGVAYLGIFDDTSDFFKPALVFHNQLGAGNEKYVAEAISHEAGHNFGLNHDGYSGGSYYPGHGSGPTGWAPIMGVGYYQELAQWSRGEYATANNGEDDLSVIPAFGGPLRADDHGNKRGTATALSATISGSTASLSGAGVIERRTDKDFFSFQSGAGTATINVNVDARSPNLDVRLKIQNAAGNTIANVNLADALPASATFSMASAGTYYVVVLGVGKGDVSGTGYSDYASLGQYTVTGTVPKP
jgi:hypothetical protein